MPWLAIHLSEAFLVSLRDEMGGSRHTIRCGDVVILIFEPYGYKPIERFAFD